MIQEIKQQELKQPTPAIHYPLSLTQFLKLKISLVEHILKPVLPVGGIYLISASEGSCKTFYCMNLACSIASGHATFLDEFEIKRKKVLYIMTEGGEPEMKRRFERMASVRGVDTNNLMVAYVPDLNIFDGKKIQEDGYQKLKKLIQDSNPDVVILDPITQFWSGNENDKQEVQGLIRILKSLIHNPKRSMIISHHWRKPSRGNQFGSNMTSGSYWWKGAVDGLITLKGNANKLTMEYGKVRSGVMPNTILDLRLREEDFWLEVTRKCTKQEKGITDEDIDRAWEHFASDRVKMSELSREAKEMNVCRSGNTLRKAIEQSENYRMDESKPRCHFVVKRQQLDIDSFKIQNEEKQ